MAPYSPIQKALGGKPYDYSATDAASQEQAYNRAKTRQTVNANKALAKAKKVPVKAHVRTVRVKPPRATKTSPSPAPAPQGGLDATTRNLIEAAVRLKFGGQTAALNQQLQGAARFASGVPAWYSQAIQQIRGQQAPVAPVSAPAPTGDPATDSRNALNAAFAQQQAQRMGSQNDFLTNVGAGLTVQQGNVLAGNAQQQNAIRQQQTQLAGQKGDFRATTLADMQAQQAKANTEQAKINASLAIASGKLDLAKNILDTVTKPKAQATIKQGRSRVRNEKARINETKQQDRVNNAIRVNDLALKSYLAAHPELKSKSTGSKGKSKFTPTQVRNAEAKFRQVQAMLKPDYVRKHPEITKRRLISEKKIDPLLAEAVVQTVAGGGVSRQTATAYYRAFGHHLKVSDKGEALTSLVLKAIGK